MAQVKLFKFDTDGMTVEHDPTADDISALSISAGTGGMSTGGDITMGGQKVTGLGDASTAGDALAFGQDGAQLGTTTFSGDVNAGGNQIGNVGDPLSPEDAANKQYVDAVVAGLDPHESVVTKTAAELTSYTASGTGVGKTLTAPTNASSHNTIDGVLLVVNDRVLVSMQGGNDATADPDNGIYKVTALGNDTDTSFELTRVTDADAATAGEMAQGLYVFVTGGTSYTNTGWNETEEVTTMETSDIKFSQFSGAPGYVFDQGLKKTVNSITVELDTDADAAGTGAGGGSSGLEFDADTAAGQLRVKVDPAGGIDRNANGIGVDLDGTTLQLDSGGAGTGLSVLGLPTQFQIGGSAVGANVTQANMDIVFGGVASDADSMHTHNGLASSGHTHAHSETTGQTANDHHNQSHVLDGGDHTVSGLTAGHVLTALTPTTFGFQESAAAEAEEVKWDSIGAENMAVGDPVYPSSNGKVSKIANTSDNTRKYVGVCSLAVTTPDDPTIVQQDGLITPASIGGSPAAGDLVWAGTTGGVTVTLPTGSGTHRLVVGKMVNASVMAIEPQYIGKIG